MDIFAQEPVIFLTCPGTRVYKEVQSYLHHVFGSKLALKRIWQAERARLLRKKVKDEDFAHITMICNGCPPKSEVGLNSSNRTVIEKLIAKLQQFMLHRAQEWKQCCPDSNACAQSSSLFVIRITF